MKREDEEFARSEFDRFLRGRTGDEKPVWDEVAQAEEPPDFYLSLGAKRYAVEVTGILSQTELGAGRVPQIGVVVSSRRFVQRIERQTRCDGSLSGAYTVTVRPIENFNDRATELEEAIANYIRKNKDAESAPAENLGRQRLDSWRIHKVHSQSDNLYFVFLPSAKFEGEIVKELRSLITDRIAEKREKLKLIDNPKILLLVDRYSWADSEIWFKSAPTSYKEFHTLFTAAHERSSFVLHTEEPKWR